MVTWPTNFTSLKNYSDVKDLVTNRNQNYWYRDEKDIVVLLSSNGLTKLQLIILVKNEFVISMKTL